MKKLLGLIVAVMVMSMVGCTPAERLANEKERQSHDTGISRDFTVISSYTNATMWTRHIENSYFTGTNQDMDIYDLKTGNKISLMATTGCLIVIEEKKVDR